MRRKTYRGCLTTALALSFGVIGCGADSSRDSSATQQITAPGNVQCLNFQDRKAEIERRYGARVTGYDGYRHAAFMTMTRLPEEYMDFVFVTARAQMSVSGPGNGGLTSWTYDREGRVPTTISTGTCCGSGFHDVVNHEMGHAAYGKVMRLEPGFEQALTAQYNYAVYQGNERRNMQSYAQNNREEYFAELFDEYYCSPEARQRMKERLPTTFEFAERYLLPPVE